MKFEIKENFYSDPVLATSFFELQEKVFPGVNLQWANDNHLISSQTIPHGLFRGNGAVSILNATKMKLLTAEGIIDVLQLGTVATDPKNCGRGFSRQLIEYVISRYEQQVDLIFLFANPGVVDFYPKFGFEPLLPSVFYLPLSNASDSVACRKLDMASDTDNKLAMHLVETRCRLSDSFCILNNQTLTKWYLNTYFKNSLFYFERHSCILVATKEENTLVVYDVIGPHFYPDFFLSLNWPKIKNLKFMFVPDKFNGDFKIAFENTEDTFYARGKVERINSVFKIQPLAQT